MPHTPHTHRERKRDAFSTAASVESRPMFDPEAVPFPVVKKLFGDLPLRVGFGGRRLVVLERTCIVGRRGVVTVRDDLLEDGAVALDCVEGVNGDESVFDVGPTLILAWVEEGVECRETSAGGEAGAPTLLSSDGRDGLRQIEGTFLRAVCLGLRRGQNVSCTVCSSPVSSSTSYGEGWPWPSVSADDHEKRSERKEDARRRRSDGDDG